MPIDASTVDLYYGSDIVDGKVSGENSDYGWAYFSPKAVNIQADVGYQITITFELENGYTAADLRFNLWSHNGNPDNSYWYWLYDGDASAIGTNTFTIGRSNPDFLDAITAGETRLLFETKGVYVTDYSIAEVDPWAGIKYSAPLALDETPEELGGSNNPYADFANWYSSAARVYDDVIFAAWMHQSNGLPGGTSGSHRGFEGVAVRHLDNASTGKVELEKGLALLGPDVSTLPGFNPPFVGDGTFYNQSYRLTAVTRIGEGRCYVQVGVHNYPCNVLGYVVQVDRATLTATVERVVYADSVDWQPEEWAWPPCPGPGRSLNQIQLSKIYAEPPYGPGSDPFPQGDMADRLMISWAEDGSELARRYIKSYDYTKPGGDGAYVVDQAVFYAQFHWNKVMCIVDMGDSFISLSTYHAGNTHVAAWRHSVVDNLPDDDPELIVLQSRTNPPSGGSFPYAWDFDGTYAAAMGNGKVFILEGDSSSTPAARFRVLDPDAGTLTNVWSVPGPPAGNAARLMDWVSLTAIDDDRAMFSILPRWVSSVQGWMVGIFDGSTVSDQQMIFPFEAHLDPYRKRSYYSSSAAEVVLLDDGRVIGVMAWDEDYEPAVPTLEDPALLNMTTAVGARLWPAAALPAISGEYLLARRRFT